MQNKIYLSIAGFTLSVLFLIPWIGRDMPGNFMSVPNIQSFADCGMMVGGMMGQGMMRSSQWMSFRMRLIHSIPTDYKGLRNPLDPTTENIISGGRIY